MQLKRRVILNEQTEVMLPIMRQGENSLAAGVNSPSVMHTAAKLQNTFLHKKRLSLEDRAVLNQKRFSDFLDRKCSVQPVSPVRLESELRKVVAAAFE
jgi:hypothetical protein